MLHREQPPAPPLASSPRAAASVLPDGDPALAHRLVEAGAVLLDVRTSEEYAEKHIDGAVSISIEDLKGRLSEVDTLTGGDKQKPIVVYCQTGRRAARAKALLVEAGHEQVTNLGGIDAWERK